MIALGFWHLLQCCTSPKLSYMPRWKRYLEKLAKADFTANTFCERTSSDSAWFLFKFTKSFSKSLLQHLFFVHPPFQPPKPYGYWLYIKYIYSPIEIQNQSSSEFNCFPIAIWSFLLFTEGQVLSILCFTFLQLPLPSSKSRALNFNIC